MALSRSKHERPHYDRPQGLLAGFIATTPESAVSELVHIGEQWAPSTFLIPDHAHDVWEFYMQIGGESRWDAEGETYILKAGDFSRSRRMCPIKCTNAPKHAIISFSPQ
jgi:hypothetical protein